MDEFRGIYPALITPMTREGDFNENAFRRLMEYNIESGAHGFWIAGGAGESVLLEDEENARIAGSAANQAAGRAKVIMHVGAVTTVRAARMAENAAEAGVDAVCAVPPFFYRPGPTKSSNTTGWWEPRRTFRSSSITFQLPRAWRSPSNWPGRSGSTYRNWPASNIPLRHS